MSSEENLCSPLLERIKQLQEKNSWHRLLSNDILMDSQPLNLANDPSLNSECFFKVNSEIPDSGSQKQDECTGMKGNCDANTLSCRDGLNHQSVEVGLNQPAKRQSVPFSYLKRGKGLARYKTRTLKGFKKRDTKNTSFQTQPASRDLSPINLGKNHHDDNTSKKLSAFEKLEALVDQDSFCSTSSRVVELLQDDSHSSSPLSQKRCVPSFPLTPILMGKNPVSENGVSIQNMDMNGSRKSQAGILRSQFPCLVSPSDLKVKFLDPGVEVLEYDDDQFEKDTTCNDSDLIDVSDLENLALLGCKVNLVQKNLSIASPGEEFQPLFHSKEPPNRFQPKLYDIAASNRELNEKIVTKTSQSNDELEINSHKMLLLAKTNELSKEISIFRNRNKALEELMKELKEKEALVQKQLEYSNFIDKEKSMTKRNVKSHYRNPQAKSNFNNVLSKKVQDLSEKLLKLEIENRNLKGKLVGLERRENNAMKLKESDGNNKDRIHKGGKLQVETRKDEAGLVKQCSSKSKSQTNSNRPIDQGYSNAYVRVALGSSKEKQPKISFKSESYSMKDEFTENSNPKASNEKASLLQDDPVYAGSRISNDSGGKILPYLSQKTCEEPSNILDVQPPQRDCDGKAKSSYSSSSIHHYPNGDKKTVFPDKTVIHYAKDNIIHTIFREDGTEEITFANGQREIYFKDGSQQLMFSDGSSKTVYKDGSEVCVCRDGTVIHQDLHSTKTVHFPNGQKEIYEKGRIRRVYPDGTMKVLNSDGSQETHYPNGHVRLKDKYGNISSGK